MSIITYLLSIDINNKHNSVLHFYHMLNTLFPLLLLHFWDKQKLGVFLVIHLLILALRTRVCIYLDREGLNSFCMNIMLLLNLMMEVVLASNMLEPAHESSLWTFFPIPYSVTSGWQLEISNGGSIYTM